MPLEQPTTTSDPVPEEKVEESRNRILADTEILSQYRNYEGSFWSRKETRVEAGDSVETLRTRTVAGISSILDAPWIIRRFLSNEDTRLLKAMRRYWQESDNPSLNKLLEYLNQEP